MLALLWSYRPRTDVYAALGALRVKQPGGRAYTQEDVKLTLREMREANVVERDPQRDGFYRLARHVASTAYAKLLDTYPTGALLGVLNHLDSVPLDSNRAWWPLYDSHKTAAFLRLAMFSGWERERIAKLRELIGGRFDWHQIVLGAVVRAFDPVLFDRVRPEVQWELAIPAFEFASYHWNAEAVPLCDWTLARLDAHASSMPGPLRLCVAEHLLLRGEGERMLLALEGLPGGYAAALRACRLALLGQWAEAVPAFQAALKSLQVEAGQRKRLMAASIAWIYPMSLLALNDAKSLETARRFCVAESGSRDPSVFDIWGTWVHVIRARLGETPLDHRLVGDRRTHDDPRRVFPDLWRLLAVAWIGIERFRVLGVDADVLRFAGTETKRLTAATGACGFAWLGSLAEDALATLQSREVTRPFFVRPAGELWRDVLAQLQALDAPVEAAAKSAEQSRLVWVLTLGDAGDVEDIDLIEQKRGTRGWNKGKSVGFSRLLGATPLSRHDQKLASAVYRDPYDRRRGLLDRAAAVVALVGHPAVVFSDAPDQFVDLTEGTPELEVVREGDRYVLRVSPRPHDDIAVASRYVGNYREGDEEGLRHLTVVRDSPQRARVIRLTATQQRAAQLLAGRFSVPEAGRAELEQTLRALAGQFQVHADSAEAAREVAAEVRLRAELAPVGDGLSLRLAVAPLGDAGPRLVPGVGRERVMAAIGGESVGTRRDLASEKAGLQAVLDALPFLDDDAGAVAACEWTVNEPEQALAMVEVLPGLDVVSGVDWPKGRSVRVATADTPQLQITVRKDREWFRLAGRVAVDESLVMDFEALLAASRGTSRFVPMGDGVYLALTRTLKQRLAEMATVVETDRHGSRVAPVSAAWLQEVLDGANLDADAGFREALERLQRAQAETHAVPTTLQAELRSYQEDGFVWASRLAAAGFGGCLADDMGLGKTLQALAVLLARGAGGPALVVAPTSVCGNWMDEGRRFAPSLRLVAFGEGEGAREAQIADAGPMDVIVVSYTMLLQAQSAFHGRRWHTVIADEAQAIKNAAAKRSLAMFELEADFRLALSGTPVENRLAELWSIMRFANPGLLGSLTRFNERFAGPIERSRDREAQQVLKRLIGPFVLRRTKAQVLKELPARTELVVTVTPEPTEAAFYEAIRREAVAEVDQNLADTTSGQARFNILAQLTRLRRAACDPRLMSGAFPAPSAKVQAFARLCADLVANHHKALVFSQFVDFLHLLKVVLDQEGIAYQYLDGSTPAAERTRRVNAFQAGEGDLFLISLKAGGFGLNLTAADYVVITDPWWNPAAEDQAMGRAHRIGQLRPVTVYRLVTAGTVEERIVALHQDKRALAEGILEDGEVAVLPSTDDLVALIRGD